MAHNFAPAVVDEALVFGAAGPASRGAYHVDAWTSFMRAEGIERVVCLLEDCGEMRRAYEDVFGAGDVLHVPIEDVGVPTRDQLERAVAFIDESAEAERKVVVHCAAGMGRTSIVLAAWLVRSRGLAVEDVDAGLRGSGAVRRLYEKVEWGVISREDLHRLIGGDVP